MMGLHSGGLREVGFGAAGVSWDSHHKRWRAEIRVATGDGKTKQRTLGRFLKEVDAALAYDRAAREHHKDKAKLNFPDLPPQPQAVVVWTLRKTTSQYRGKSR
jgi:hypothetical protein